jgi:hypothetical protein
MLDKSNNVAANLVIAIALVALAGAPMIGAVEMEDAVKLDGNKAMVTLANGKVHEVEIQYQPDVKKGKSLMQVQVTDKGMEQSFAFDEAQSKIVVEADGQTLEISMDEGKVTIGNVECDGAGGDWQCISDAINSQVNLTPAAVMAAYASLSNDLNSEGMHFGDEIKATFHLMARDAHEVEANDFQAAD